MPRSLRLLHPGAWYHVTSRGIERRSIFQDDGDRRHFLELLEGMVNRFGVGLHAYVLMGNHYHLLLELTRPNLSRAVQWLNLSHSVWFNRRHQRVGYLFQGRFKSIVLEPTRWGIGMSSYIHLNPVRVANLGLDKSQRKQSRRGLGQLPTAELVRRRLEVLRSYRWSSYRACIGLSQQPPWLDCEGLLELGGGDPKNRRRIYRTFVEGQVREGLKARPWEELEDAVLLGGEQFLRKVKEVASRKLAPGRRQARWSKKMASLKEVIEVVEKVRGEGWNELKERHGDPARDLMLFLARRATDMTVSALAKAVNLKGQAQASMAIKRYQKRLEQDVAERRIARRASEMLYVML